MDYRTQKCLSANKWNLKWLDHGKPGSKYDAADARVMYSCVYRRTLPTVTSTL